MTSTDTRLWAGATLTFCVGDLATTAIGISLLGAVEANHLPALLIDGVGLWALVPLKLLAMALFAALYVHGPEEWRVGVPLALLAVGLVIMANNVHVLLTLLTAP